MTVGGARGSAYTVERGDHACIAYRDDRQHRDLLASHLTAALERAEKIVYVADTAPTEPLSAWLRSITAESEALVRRGQLLIRPPVRFRIPNGRFAPERVVDFLGTESSLAARSGYAGLRVCLEMTWVADEPRGQVRLVAYERLLTGLLAGEQALGLALICQYDERRFADEQLRQLQQAHPIVLHAALAIRRAPLLRLSPLDDGAGLRVEGEIDRSNAEQLATALRSALAAEQDLHLDLEGLEFADIAAVRLLAQAATSLSDGHRLILLAPSPVLRRVLQVQGWDKLPALQMRGAQIDG
jgi:anti-anti-sigma factor